MIARFRDHGNGPEQHAEGEWVRVSDYKAAVAALCRACDLWCPDESTWSVSDRNLDKEIDRLIFGFEPDGESEHG